MTRSRLKILAVAGLLAFAGQARADLLDEEDSVKPQPQPAPDTSATGPDDTGPETPPTNGQGTAPAKGSKPKQPAVIDDDSRLKAPTPHPKSTQPSASTTVIPPKNPGAPAKKGQKHDNTEPVHFDSKGLKGLRTKGMVELIEDVVVTQGDMRMEADHAQVYFDEGSKDKKDRGLQKVIAEGAPVKISGIDENSGEKFRAFGNQVVYLSKERTVVLEGNARLWRGDDSVIRSRKITYEMDTGWIKADRVAGELQPPEKGAPTTPHAPPPATPPAPPPAGGSK